MSGTIWPFSFQPLDFVEFMYIFIIVISDFFIGTLHSIYIFLIFNSEQSFFKPPSVLLNLFILFDLFFLQLYILRILFKIDVFILVFDKFITVFFLAIHDDFILITLKNNVLVFHDIITPRNHLVCLIHCQYVFN